MLAFSWTNTKKRAIEKKKYRAKVLAGGMKSNSPANPDFKIMHADWVRDVHQSPVVMNKRIEDDTKKRQEEALMRRAKYAPR